jgi:hypothetical protein
MSFGGMGKSIHAMGHDLVDRAPLIAVGWNSREVN